MATGQPNGVLRHLRRATLLPDGAGLTDGQLLADYVRRRDEAALAALVRRHAPMVWGVCRRVLSRHHDAEDAFQATFLVLVRRAASIAAPELLANWLYGVAHQTARKARATAAKRAAREKQVTEMPEPAAAEQALWNDLRPLLDEELSRLPDVHRAVLVLCELEGKTRAEAARQLGLHEGTIASRLARARGLLAKRLTARGVTLSGAALAALLSRNVAAAGVPNAVVANAIRAAAVFASGQGVAGAVSVSAAALAEGVLRAMLVMKLKAVIAVVLMLGSLVTGATVLAGRMATPGDQPPVAEKPVTTPPKRQPEREKEGFVAWGQPVGGLQAGLGLPPGAPRVYRHGETLTLFVRVRNVGKEPVKFEYLTQFLDENPPTVTAADGTTAPQEKTEVTGVKHVPVGVNLAPGKEIALKSRISGVSGLRYEFRPASRRGKGSGGRNPSLFVGAGKVRLQYEQVFGDTSAGGIKLDPALGKLATGTLELEVQPEPPPADEKKPEQEKEGFTVWGEAVGGLQAGLGLRPGAPRAYRLGETVTLFVRVRNVGKEAVKFEYLKQFLDEEPPTATDAARKTLRQNRIAVLGFHVPVEVTLAPGKEIALETRMHGAAGLPFELRPTGGGGKPSDGKSQPLFVGTGKVRFQYERVLGNSSSGRIQLDPALSKLGTGTLEFEIQPEARAATENK